MNGKLVQGSALLVNCLTTLGTLLFILYLIMGSTFLFLTGCMMLVLGLYPRIYLRMVSQSFSFNNHENDKMVLTNGDTGELSLTFINRSALPMIGSCEVEHDPYFRLVGENPSENRLIFPLSVQKRQSATLTLPFETVGRGIGRVTKLTVSLNDPLKLLSCRLRYEYVRKTVVIYPRKKPVMGNDGQQLVKEGPHSHPSSLFVDRSLPIGTRDYVQGDSLKDIHWKATARKGDLQTKLVEKTIGMTWSFVILLGPNMPKHEIASLEEQLSALARLAELAHKRDIDFNLIVNTKPMGRSLIIQTPFGSDRSHYFRVMERLAAIQVNFLRIDPKLTIREITRGLREPRVLFFAGSVKEVLDDPLLLNWQRKGLHLYKIEESGSVVPLQKGGEAIAK
ncbi:DUF58 domain-containing protein [Pullulanibacillus sp. KACC 23026]|uniref:DUF58 domain-containing protein n=1 Tax=Pullulanibacillus sp. KACC 23026 TaxID=3028315 RepID=UPI0023B05184|nr:DUF58 domain-containing protein [Pullulanibacillus sp. KACC 23026]WEG14351.1 DUF58 domain-containing protein [Pullulanibacillus sp. KACC 23026]